MRERPLWLTEGKAVEFTAADLASLDLFHLFRDEVDGAADILASRFEVLTNHGRPLIVLFHGLLGLIHDHDLRSRFRYPYHLLDGTKFIGEEVDPAHVKHAV